jgi:ketosteroid isomerase-like protein
MVTDTAVTTDLATLTDLNLNYVRSVEESDVAWFDQMLAEDFLCTLSDGSLVDRTAFLEHTAHPAGITNLREHDVNVRLLGEYAIIHARTTFLKTDGQPGASRYTDVWERRGGRWVCVSAQITRY